MKIRFYPFKQVYKKKIEIIYCFPLQRFLCSHRSLSWRILTVSEGLDTCEITEILLLLENRELEKFLDCVLLGFAQSKQFMSYHFFPLDYLNTKLSQVVEQSQKLVSTLFLAFFIVMELGRSTKGWHELL